MVRQIRSLSLTKSLFIILLTIAPATAQFGVRVDIKTAARSSGSSSGPIVRRPVVVQKVSNRVITKTEVVHVSNLSVVTEPGAKVVLESLAKSAKPPTRDMVADRSGSAIFDDVKPGDYKVSSAKEGFATQEQDLVKIAPQRPHVLDLSLSPITYDLRIRTNVTDGEVRYAQAEYKGKGPDGSIIAEEFGNKCFVKIQKEGGKGVAVISDLKKGYYNLDIRPAELQYEPALVGLNVPQDAEQEVAGQAKSFEIDLEKRISTEVFGAAWTKEEWAVPSGWAVNNRMRVNNAAGVALPQNDRYRYYTNFQLISDIKMPDGGTAGFALRAVDPLNYYMVEISGPNAPEPNFVKAFIVKNGQASQFASVPAPFASTITSKNGFRVIIKGDEKGFSMWIENSETGVRKPVTIITDPYNTYQKGAVGVASRGRANFEVTYFQVCPSECH